MAWVKNASDTILWAAQSGNVGIGISSPSVAMHAVGKVRAQKSGQTTAYVQLSADELTSNYAADIFVNDTGLTFKHNSNSRGFVFDQNGNTRLTIDSSGNVGIGTSNVDELLHIEKTAGTTLVKTEVAANSIVGFEIKKTNATTSNWRIADGQVANGQLEIFDVTNSRSIFNADGSEIVINDTSADLNFRVESNGNANMVFVDAGSDYVAIGTSADFGETFNVSGGGHFSSNVTLSRQTNDAGSTGLIMEKTRNTTVNGNTVVASGDQLGFIGFKGNDGDQFIDGAFIIAEVDGTPGNNDMPARLTFHTTADGASSVSERMRITSAGRVGINRTSPNGLLHMQSASGSNSELYIQTSAGTDESRICFGDDQSSIAGQIQYIHNGNNMAFRVNGSEAARFDSSQNFIVGGSSIGDQESTAIASTGDMTISRASGVGRNMIIFKNASSTVGSITTNTSATTYNTSSDQRLKENIVDAPSASDDIDAIQVRSFDWKADGSHQKYGMVAQELTTVAPEAVYTPEDPDEMMGVDYSKLVPMLIKEIQSLRNRVAELEGE